MAAKKGAKKKTKAKRPKRANPSHGGSPGATIVPRGMMLVPTGARNPARSKKKGHRRPRRHNPEGWHLKSGVAAVGFGAAAATVGMLGGWALSKANLKSKWANVAANAATGAIAGGWIGMADRTAGTIVAHNYLVAAGQWINASDGASDAPQARSHVSPGMLRTNHAPTNGLGEEQPDPESITRALPAPQLAGYQRFEGLGSPLDHLGSPLDHLGGVIADDVGDDVEGYAHLDGILADNLGEEVEAINAVMADDIGEDELGDDLGDDELGFMPG